MSEVRVAREGTLRFVQGSGSGTAWTTASAPASGTLGYVQSFSFTSGQNLVTISDRGNPDHHKVTMKNPIDLTVNYLWTGGFHNAGSGSGASVPFYHFEWRAATPEVGDGTSAFYYQFYGVAQVSNQVSEQTDGDTIAITYRALRMLGPTGSGYLG